jgi:hypothetical protein
VEGCIKGKEAEVVVLSLNDLIIDLMKEMMFEFEGELIKERKIGC